MEIIGRGVKLACEPHPKHSFHEMYMHIYTYILHHRLTSNTKRNPNEKVTSTGAEASVPFIYVKQHTIVTTHFSARQRKKYLARSPAIS